MSYLLIRNLNWDSQHFDMNCGHLKVPVCYDVKKLNDALLNLEKYDFVSINVENCCLQGIEAIAKQCDAVPVEVNLQFVCPVVPPQTTSSDICIQWAYPEDDDIIDIAHTAFEHSRFIRDKNLFKRGGDLIYVEWVKNAFDHQDKCFITKKKGGRTEGFVLFSKNDDVIRVELIAVGSNRGHGIGKSLWSALVLKASEYGAKEIHVGTQAINHQAIAFYHKVGGRIVQTNQIFHWWKQHEAV